LIWFSLRAVTPQDGEGKWDYLLNAWHEADKFWLIFMAIVAVASHMVRAIRWKMMLAPVGYHSKITNSFLSLMVGYLVNLVIPRGGELSRCYNLYKLDKTPVDVSFGTVVLERIIDLIFLATLIIVSFTLESEKLFAFIETLPLKMGSSSTTGSTFPILLIVLMLVVAVFIWLVSKNERVRNFLTKTWAGFKNGFLSIFKLKQKGVFVFYSGDIWAVYFFMIYAVIMAFPSTSVVGLNAVLSLFAIGAIAMAAPLPGGAGSYHVLVPAGLVFLYQLPEADAVAFTFIFHGWQTFIMIVVGAISLLITSFLVKKKV
jgi:uncharacterized protein (TIRG00374 family)